MGALLQVVGAAVALPAIMAIAFIWGGYVLSVLWGWFVVPAFGVPHIGVAAAIGIGLLVKAITYQPDASKSDRNEPHVDKMAKSFAVAFLVPLLNLGIGWVVKQFM